MLSIKQQGEGFKKRGLKERKNTRLSGCAAARTRLSRRVVKRRKQKKNAHSTTKRKRREVGLRRESRRLNYLKKFERGPKKGKDRRKSRKRKVWEERAFNGEKQIPMKPESKFVKKPVLKRKEMRPH